MDSVNSITIDPVFVSNHAQISSLFKTLHETRPLYRAFTAISELTLNPSDWM